ncbi:MAG: conjugal transfer protein TraD [Devosia sp.]|nr:conjugal transfer protein TraD [Devosia sp.]
MQLARTHDRKKDTREKIQLGGLIAKAGLRYEKRALLLGLLIEAKRNLAGNAEERARLLTIGEEAFRNDPQEADVAADPNPADDGDRIDDDGDRAMDGKSGNDR